MCLKEVYSPNVPADHTSLPWNEGAATATSQTQLHQLIVFSEPHNEEGAWYARRWRSVGGTPCQFQHAARLAGRLRRRALYGCVGNFWCLNFPRWLFCSALIGFTASIFRPASCHHGWIPATISRLVPLTNVPGEASHRTVQGLSLLPLRVIVLRSRKESGSAGDWQLGPGYCCSRRSFGAGLWTKNSFLRGMKNEIESIWFY